MVAWRYHGISLLVFNSIFHSFAALIREISSVTLEEKFNISARPCIILYMLWTTQLILIAVIRLVSIAPSAL